MRKVILGAWGGLVCEFFNTENTESTESTQPKAESGVTATEMERSGMVETEDQRMD